MRTGKFFSLVMVVALVGGGVFGTKSLVDWIASQRNKAPQALTAEAASIAAPQAASKYTMINSGVSLTETEVRKLVQGTRWDDRDIYLYSSTGLNASRMEDSSCPTCVGFFLPVGSAFQGTVLEPLGEKGAQATVLARLMVDSEVDAREIMANQLQLSEDLTKVAGSIGGGSSYVLYDIIQREADRQLLTAQADSFNNALTTMSQDHQAALDSQYKTAERGFESVEKVTAIWAASSTVSLLSANYTGMVPLILIIFMIAGGLWVWFRAKP
jgi:hypothetical protein